MTTNPRYANGNRRRTTRARVLARDDTCWLCKQPVDKTLRTPHPWSPEVHEIIPISRGGSPYDSNNVTLTHRRCNQWISDRTPEELAQLNKRQSSQPTQNSQDW